MPTDHDQAVSPEQMLAEALKASANCRCGALRFVSGGHMADCPYYEGLLPGPWDAEAGRILATLAERGWHLSNTPPDSLDAAWKAAEAALPEGWEIMWLRWVPTDLWSVHAQARRESALGGVLAWEQSAEGPTPAAALNALTEQLRSAK